MTDEPEPEGGTLEAIYFGLAKGLATVDGASVRALLDGPNYKLVVYVETRTPEDADALLEALGDELQERKPAHLWVAIESRIV